MRALLTKFIGFTLIWLPLTLPAPAQTSSDYLEGLAAFRAGDYAQAAELFRRADAAAPGTTDALLLAAKAFVHLEKHTDADSSLRGYLVQHAESAEALYLLGYVLNRENRPANSLEIYTKAAARQSPTGDDLKIVGLNYALLNDYASAIHWLEKAVELDPKNHEAWYFLGRAYYTRGLLPEAESAFEKVLQLNPNDAKAENNIGLILESEARPTEAIEAYKQAIVWQQKTAHSSEQPYLNLGSILLHQERNEEAVPALEQAVKRAPGNPFCRLKLGTAYLRLSRLENARSELQEAARLDPENAAVHFQLGKLYKQMHAMDRAKKEFGRAEDIQSRDAMATKPKP